jgi:ABC-type phosphate transport system permease subunit
MVDKNKKNTESYMPDEQAFQRGLAARNRRGIFGRVFYYFSVGVAILALITLFLNVINQSFGAVAQSFTINPGTLAGDGRTLDELNAQELADILVEYEANLRVLVRDRLSTVDSSVFTTTPLNVLAPSAMYPEGYADSTVNEISDLENGNELLAEFMALNLSDADMRNIVLEEVAELQTLQAWGLADSTFNWAPSEAQQNRASEIVTELEANEAQQADLTAQLEDLEAQVSDLRAAGTEENRAGIDTINAEISEVRTALTDIRDQFTELRDELEDLVSANITTDVQAEYCTGEYRDPEELSREEIMEIMNTPFEEAGCNTQLIRYQSWLDADFLRTPMSSVPAQAGIRTAILGSMLMMVIVIVVSLPIGVGTAIYLEEYASQNFISRLIETNVRTLAGVPSIIYGLLGLAIFVRLLAPVTSGIVFGVNVETRTADQAITAIEDGIGMNDLYEVTDEGEYAGINEDGTLSPELSQNLLNTYLRLGNAGLSNLYGSISTEVAESSIRRALGIEGEVTGDAEETITLGDDSTITVQQYNLLVRSLEQFSSFTVNGRTILSASLTLALLILPIVIINAQEALRAVPFAVREASYGLGATKLETTIKVVLPAALSGILAAFIVAISRAVGETMIVAIAAGAGPQNNIAGLLRERGPGIIFEPAETMTGHMARISGGDLSYDSIDYVSIFAIGLTLFLITLVLNLISRQILNRFREAY